MAARLRAAGFDGDDVQVFSPAPRKGNLVARLRGAGVREPILLMAASRRRGSAAGGTGPSSRSRLSSVTATTMAAAPPTTRTWWRPGWRT